MWTRNSADQRNAAHDGHADAQPPIGVLIKTQDLPGEGHPESHQEQKDANDPGQLAGKLVSPEQGHLAHVDEHHRDHEVGTPAMHAAQEPSQGDTVVEILQAVPGFACRGNIDQRQHDAGENLEDEESQSSAAEDVPPARRFARDFVRGRLADRTADLKPLLEPVPDLL